MIVAWKLPELQAGITPLSLIIIWNFVFLATNSSCSIAVIWLLERLFCTCSKTFWKNLLLRCLLLWAFVFKTCLLLKWLLYTLLIILHLLNMVTWACPVADCYCWRSGVTLASHFKICLCTFLLPIEAIRILGTCLPSKILTKVTLAGSPTSSEGNMGLGDY